MKNIVLIGEWYSDNLGDGLLCQVVEKMLSLNYKVTRFDLSLKKDYQRNNNLDYSFDIQKMKKNYFKDKCIYYSSFLGLNYEQFKYKNYYARYKKIVESFFENNDIDAVVFAGGQVFGNGFIQRIKIIVDISKKNKIPVFFNACGYSSRITIQNKKALKEILNKENVKYISLRDNDKELSKLTNKKIYPTFDTALYSSNILVKKVDKKIDLGIGIMYSPYSSISNQINFWSKLLITLKDQKKIKWKVFVNGSATDYAFASYLLKKLNLDPNEYLLDRPVTPEQLVNTIICFKKAITMRLHSIIVSYSYKIPAIAVNWHHKIEEFYKRIHVNNMVVAYKTSPIKVITKVENSNSKIEFKDWNKVEREILNNITRLKNKIDTEVS